MPVATKTLGCKGTEERWFLLSLHLQLGVCTEVLLCTNCAPSPQVFLQKSLSLEYFPSLGSE